eukprot:TRINITY_DN1630_c0_g1_i1.p1 TRINITY_DN1630_c0_g1~~TRINITY_DN1630_c0_g1_i1.p1  ORF type:complete len:453 (+),score=35.01 TRINITY_DN1630_c0_g1_i1:325-1683(+)
MISTSPSRRVDASHDYDIDKEQSKPPSRTRSRTPVRTVTTQTAVATRTRSRTRSKSPARGARRSVIEEETQIETIREVFKVPKKVHGFFDAKKVTLSSLILFAFMVIEVICLALLNYPPALHTTPNLFTYLRTQVYLSAVPILLSIPALCYVANPTAHFCFHLLNAFFSLVNLCWFYNTRALWNSCDPALLPAEEVELCKDFKQWYINLKGFSLLLYGEQVIRCAFSVYQAYTHYNASRLEENKRLKTGSNLPFVLPSIILALLELFFLGGLQFESSILTSEGSLFGKRVLNAVITTALGVDVNILFPVIAVSLVYFIFCVVLHKESDRLFMVGQTVILFLTLLSVAYEENWDVFHPEKAGVPENVHVMWSRKTQLFSWLLIGSQLLNVIALGRSIFCVGLDLMDRENLREAKERTLLAEQQDNPIIDRLVFSPIEEEILNVPSIPAGAVLI